MDNQDENPPGRKQTPIWLQTVVISLIVTALMAGPIKALHIINPVGPWQALPVAALFVALEASTTTWWLPRARKRFNKVAFRAAELIILLVLMRLVAWILDGQSLFVAPLRDYLINPLLLINRTYVVLFLLTVLTWERSSTFASIFQQLDITPFEKQFYAARYGPTGRGLVETLTPIDRQKLLNNFVREWMIGGLILAFFATLTTFDLNMIDEAFSETISLRSIGRLGLAPEILFALLVYFIGGLWLASLGRLKVVESRWLAGDFEVDQAVLQGWRRTSVTLLAFVALIAAFLPIGSTFAISRLFQLFLSGLLFVLNILVAVISYLFFLVISRLGTGEPLPPPEREDLLSEMPQIPGAPGPTSDTPALIAGSLFWIVAISVTILAFIFFLKARGLTLRTGVLSTWLSTIRSWINAAARILRKQVEDATTVVRNRLRAATLSRAAPLPAIEFPSLGRLPPRLQIRLIYISLVRKAGREGVKRNKGDTPLEYGADLKAAWPDASEDLDALTAAFLMARYSPEKIDKDRLAPVKNAWNRLKSLIRKQE